MPLNAYTDNIDAKTDVNTDHADQSYLEVAKSIGTFVDDPPDTAYQRAYLVAICDLFVEKYAAIKNRNNDPGMMDKVSNMTIHGSDR